MQIILKLNYRFMLTNCTIQYMLSKINISLLIEIDKNSWMIIMHLIVNIPRIEIQFYKLDMNKTKIDKTIGSATTISKSQSQYILRPVSFCPTNDQPNQNQFSNQVWVKDNTMIRNYPSKINQPLQYKQSTNSFDRITFMNVPTQQFLPIIFPRPQAQHIVQVPYFRENNNQSLNDEQQLKVQPRDSHLSYVSNFQNQKQQKSQTLTFSGFSSKKKYPDVQQNFRKTQSKSKYELDQEQVQFAHLGKKMESQALIKTGDRKYSQIVFKISQLVLEIEKTFVTIKSIQKLTLYQVGTEILKFNILKLNMKNQINKQYLYSQISLGLKRSMKWGQFPLPYCAFAKLIIKKLKTFGICQKTYWVFPQNQPRQFLVKIKQMNSQSPTSRSKSHFQHTNSLKADSKEHKNKLQKQINNETNLQATCSSSKSKSRQKQKIVQKNNTQVIQKSQCYVTYLAKTFIYGKIYKKSKFLGRWQKRYIIINQLGIYSYRNQQDQNSSISIPSKNIDEISTTFNILLQQQIKRKKSSQYDQQWQYKVKQYKEQRQISNLIIELNSKQNSRYNYFVIIKIKHNLEYTQFGIPICNFDSDSQSKNWLLAFFRVMPNTNAKK